MFVDASAIIAILTEEPGADDLADLLDTAAAPITSPLAIFEAVLGVCRKRGTTVEKAETEVHAFLRVENIAIIAISAQDGAAALAAHARYGKGRKHPARLNLGDCFAYAMAKNHRTPLLFKGDDFSKTDIRRAVRS